MTELRPTLELCTPHILEFIGDVPSVEEVLAFNQTAVVWTLIFRDESFVGESAVDLYWVVVADKFYACNTNVLETRETVRSAGRITLVLVLGRKRFCDSGLSLNSLKSGIIISTVYSSQHH